METLRLRFLVKELTVLLQGHCEVIDRLLEAFVVEVRLTDIRMGSH